MANLPRAKHTQYSSDHYLITAERNTTLVSFSISSTTDQKQSVGSVVDLDRVPIAGRNQTIRIEQFPGDLLEVPRTTLATSPCG
jgi:hypothetical protein